MEYYVIIKTIFQENSSLSKKINITAHIKGARWVSKHQR